jgi:hypothetical protein
MWINNRSYDENNRFPGVGSDRPTKYDYDENRIVYGIELLTGFIKKFDHFIIEIYFGGGVRSIKSDRTITQWHIYKKENVNQYNINYLNPPKNITITTTSPSLQIGVNFSFSLYRKKSRSATF